MAKQVRPRGAYAKSATRRAAIAQAVLDLVNERGHRAVTSLEVARRAEMNESTVLYHFPTREDLLVAAMQHAERHPLSRITDTGVSLYEIAAEHAVMGVAHINYSRLFVTMQAEATDPSHPAHEWFLRHNAGSIAVLARDIRTRQEDGLADPGIDAVRAARQIVAVWDGLQAQWLIDPSFDIGAELTAAMAAIAQSREVGPPAETASLSTHRPEG
ncbi:TetR family transcriptional regulator [Microbacterium invictum]|uniref:AcrR family transcriptional regulator n=1 Tax=Microbacterium invictum TaxID=515415 RepID=A0AA40SRB0_9MICO|nr:TetR/AcrR family transcriptional regulator [Microbacterium invictum]MBB4140805.1 AcrR family transcriptional regulator [Microbacterium invictum]